MSSSSRLIVDLATIFEAEFFPCVSETETTIVVFLSLSFQNKLVILLVLFQFLFLCPDSRNTSRLHSAPCGQNKLFSPPCLFLLPVLFGAEPPRSFVLPAALRLSAGSVSPLPPPRGGRLSLTSSAGPTAASAGHAGSWVRGAELVARLTPHDEPVSGLVIQLRLPMDFT